VKLWDHTSIAVGVIHANATLLPVTCSCVARLSVFQQTQ